MGIQPIRIVIAGVDKFSAELAKTMSGIKKTGTAIREYGAKLSMGLTLPIVAAGAASMKLSADFNAAMANVATMIPNASGRMNELKKNVQDLAISTGQSTSDIAGGLYMVVSAFGDTADTAKILEINTKAAVAGVATVTDAINLTSAVTKAYGDTSTEALGKVSDLAFLTVKLGQTTFPDLANSIGRVTPLASSMGVKMEELFAVMATSTGVTGGAAEVSTQLRGVLSALAKPSAQLAGLLKYLGYESGNAMIAELGLGGSIKKMKEMAEKAKMPLGDLLGNVEAQTIALAIGGNLYGDYTKKLDSMGNASGSTAEAFNEQSKGMNKTGFAMKQAQQRLTVLGQQFGDVLLPVLAKVVGIFEPFMKMLNDMSPSTKIAVAAVLGLVAAIGPLLVTIGTVMTLMAPLMAAVAEAGGVFALLSNPIGWVVAGCIALGAIIAFVSTRFNTSTGKMMVGMMPLVGVVSWIINRWSRIVPFFKIIFVLLGAAFKAFVNFAMPVLKPIGDFFEWLGNLMTNVLDALLGALEKLAGVLPTSVLQAAGFSPEMIDKNKGAGASAAEKLRVATAAGTTNTNKNETKIVIDNKAGAQVRTETAKGDVDVETYTGASATGE